MKPLHLIAFFASAAIAACAGDGSSSSPTEDDASVVDMPARSATDASTIPPTVCGDGKREAPEGCDDGNNVAKDGCNETCRSEPNFSCITMGTGPTQCAPIPAIPKVENALSMAPGRELWTWNKPEGAVRFELWMDGIPITVDPQATRFSPAMPMPTGEHVASVRACNRLDGCSDWFNAKAKVERLGPVHVRGLDSSARAMVTTALGNRVLVACDHCGAPTAQPTTLARGRDKLTRAIVNNGADAVKLSTALIGDKLYVVDEDANTAGTAAPLTDVLKLSLIQENDAIVVLDVVEEDAATALVQALSKLITEQPALARNGRPLVVQTSYPRRALLKSLSDALANNALQGPYVRYWLQDNAQDQSGAGLYSQDGKLLDELAHVDAVVLDYRLPNLFNRMARARANKRGIFLDKVPGPGHGEIVLASLRDEANGFVTDYQVAQARSIVSAKNIASYVSAREATAKEALVKSNLGQELRTETRSLGSAASPASALGIWNPGTPSLEVGTSNDWYGPAFRFRHSALRLSTASEPPLQGVVASASFTASELGSSGALTALFFYAGPTSSFPSAMGFTPKLRAVWQDREAQGFLEGAAPTPCASANGVFEEELEPHRSYWVVWSVDRLGRNTRVFIDGRCALGAPMVNPPASQTQYLPESPVPNVLGAAFVSGGALETSFLSGAIQQAQVLRFQPPSGHELN